MRQGWLLFCVLVALMPLPATAQQDPAMSWLDRMSHSFREQNYSGLFTFERGDQIESLRIDHAVIDNKEYERLTYLDGDKRQVVRRAHDLDCIHAGQKLVRFFHHKSAPQDVEHVRNYYELVLSEGGRIADRDVVILDALPRDTHRYQHRLYLDRETALLLRSELIGTAGKVLERFQFVDIEIGVTFSADEFSAEYQLAHNPEPIMPAKKTVAASWSPDWLPPGFTAVNPQDPDAPVDMLSYSDGFAVFSVFVEPAEAFQDLQSESRRGAMLAYSQGALLAGQPHQVIVVGEIPAPTAQRIASSLAVSQ